MARTRCGGARWVVCAALMAGLGMTGARGARAEGPPPAAKADQSKQAELLLEEGLSEIRARRWSKARTFLLGAFRAQRHWRIAAHLGRVEMELGRMRDAAEHLTFLLHERRDLPAADRAQVLKMLAQARAKVGAVMVTVSPAGAEVLVDGEVVGVAPLVAPVFVEAGGHRVEVRAEGYERGEQAMVARAGREEIVSIALVPNRPQLPDDSNGSGARSHQGSSSAKWLFAGTAGAVAALGIGVGLTVAALVKKGERDDAAAKSSDACRKGLPGCPELVVELDSARSSFANAAMYAYIAAGALGTATLVYALVPGSNASDVKASVAIGPQSARAAITVSW